MHSPGKPRPFARFFIAGIIFCLGLAPACTLAELPAAPATSFPSAGGLAWVQVYFTHPDPPDQIDQGIDQVVVPVLNAARASIQVATFDFTLFSIAEALAQAQARGVKVQVVLDGVNGAHELKGGSSSDTITFLKRKSISVVDGGRARGLMHDKFMIVDGRVLFTGSWNLSYNDTFRNNNNLLKITDPRLIANYQAKFNELFVDQKFGPDGEVRALQPRLIISGTPVENYFAPADQVTAKLVAAVQASQKSIRFLAYTFTDKSLANAMLKRARAGVTVQGVIETRNASEGVFGSLYCARLPVKLDGNKYTMHDKVIIIDDQTVITGSFNFTSSADWDNDENVLVIHNPQIAAQYLQEFDWIYGLGKLPVSSPACNVAGG